jgi:hypothetical protein
VADGKTDRQMNEQTEAQSGMADYTSSAPINKTGGQTDGQINTQSGMTTGPAVTNRDAGKLYYIHQDKTQNLPSLSDGCFVSHTTICNICILMNL